MSDETEIKETTPASDEPEIKAAATDNAENEINPETPASKETGINLTKPAKKANSVKEKFTLLVNNAVSALKTRKKAAISLLVIAVLSGGVFIFKDKIWKPELQIINQPVFTPDPGDYKSKQAVMITCDVDGAEIKYTLDASDPDESSLIYSAPIIINTKTTIKAIAVKDEMATSEIAAAEYKIQENAAKNNSAEPLKDLPKLINDYGDARKKSEYDSIIKIGRELMVKNPAKAIEYEADIAWAYAEKGNLTEAEKKFEILIDKLKGGDEKAFKALLEKIINYKSSFGPKLYQKISDEAKNKKYNEIAIKAEGKKPALTPAPPAAGDKAGAIEKTPLSASDKTRTAGKIPVAANDKADAAAKQAAAPTDKAKVTEKNQTAPPDKTIAAEKSPSAAPDKAGVPETLPIAANDKTKTVKNLPVAPPDKTPSAEKKQAATPDKTNVLENLPAAAANQTAEDEKPLAPPDKSIAPKDPEKMNSNAEKAEKIVENNTEPAGSTDEINDNIVDPVFTSYILEPVNGREILRSRVGEMEISGKLIKPVGGKKSTDYEKASESFNNANFDEAMRLYCSALKYRRKIYDHLKNGRPLKSISSAGSIDPGDIKIINDIGCVYAVYGSDDWAIAFLEWATCLNPNYTLAYKNLFNLYVHNGMFDRAKDLINELSRVYPKGLEIELLMADMNYKLAKANKK